MSTERTSPRSEDAALFWLAAIGPPGVAEVGESLLVYPAATEHQALALRIPARSSGELATRAGFIVIFDGRLHEIAPLAGDPVPPDSSPAELVLDAYRRRGADVVRLLRGEFALLIWDKASGDLVLARDPVGRRPLCYGEQDGRFAVSPSPELAASAVGTDLNSVAIAEWVLSGTSDVSETFYSRVRRLPPGHILERRSGVIAVTPYWTPPTRVRRDWDPREAHEEFERLLRTSVRRAVERGRVGVFLSGGIDSALVAAIATEESLAAGVELPVALAMRFPYPEADESVRQRAVASDLGIEFVTRTLDEASGPAGTLIAGLRQSERDWFPPTNPWQAAYDTLIWEAVCEGCATILSGEGGNLVMEPTWDDISRLVFGLHVRLLARLTQDWPRYDPAARRLGVLRAALLQSSRSVRRRVFASAIGRLRPLGIDRTAETLVRRRAERIVPTWAVPDRELREIIVERRATRMMSESGADRPWPVSADLNGATTLLETSFLLGCRLKVDLDDVYHYPELLSLRAQLPISALLFGGRYKGLGHATYSGIVGEIQAEVPRTASFERVFEIIFERELAGALSDLGGLPALSRLGVVDPGEFKRLTREGSQLQAIGYYQIWQTLACEAWLRPRSYGGGSTPR